MQVSSLIYSTGHEADILLRSFRLTAAEQSSYNMIKQKFDNFFVKKRNIIYERARLNLRKQGEGESAASFIHVL